MWVEGVVFCYDDFWVVVSVGLVEIDGVLLFGCDVYLVDDDVVFVCLEFC